LSNQTVIKTPENSDNGINHNSNYPIHMAEC